RAPPRAPRPEPSLRLYQRWGIGYFFEAGNQVMGEDAMPADVMGRLELDEPLPAYVSLVFRPLVLQTQSVEPGTKEVVFVLPASALEALLGGVRVRVIDEETRPPIG